jgi:YD repeat-containing protein
LSGNFARGQSLQTHRKHPAYDGGLLGIDLPAAEEDYVYPTLQPRTMLLKLFWHSSREDNFTTGPLRWSETTYDGLRRVTLQRAPAGSEMRTSYNEGTRPSAARVQAGQTTRVTDGWGREQWTQINGLGQLVQVVEPNPNGSISVFHPSSIRTVYPNNAFGQVLEVLQGPSPHQVRAFHDDSLGRLTQQQLPKKQGTLNRLKTLTYDMSGFGGTAHPILPAPSVSYKYMTTGDVTRLFGVTTTGVSAEYGYDTEGRLSSKTLTLTQRPTYPLVIGYLYDSLHWVWELEYSAQYGMAGARREIVHTDYDVASRLKGSRGVEPAMPRRSSLIRRGR